MSLLLKSKDILFHDAVEKVVDPKSFFGKKLKHLSLQEVEKYLKERAFLETVLKALSHEKLLSSSEETGLEPSKSLKDKVSLLKKLLKIKHMSILAITYFPKVIKPLFIDSGRQKKSFQIILDSKTADSIKKMNSNSNKLNDLLREKIEPLIDEKDHLANIKLVRYQKDLDVILLYQTDYPAFLSKKLDDSFATLLKKVVEQPVLLGASNSSVKDQKGQRKESLHKGLKNFFLHQKKNYLDKTIKTIMDAFSLKTILFLKRIDDENEIYQMKHSHGSDKYVKEDVELDILDLLSIHTDETLADKIFSNPSKALPEGTVIFQALFINGPERVVIPVTTVEGDEFLGKKENLESLRSLLEHLFLSEESLK